MESGVGYRPSGAQHLRGHEVDMGNPGLTFEAHD
jgi:hypothetical protein